MSWLVPQIRGNYTSDDDLRETCYPIKQETQKGDRDYYNNLRIHLGH